jgi:hypothetical protein
MLLGLAIMTAFIPNVVGAVSPTAWAIMWLIIPIYLLKCKIEMTSIHWLGLLFLSYASLSLLWSPHGALDLLQWFALAGVFMWSASLKDIKAIVIGSVLGLIVSDVIAIFGIDIFKLTDKPAGLFVNSNVFAETSGMILILLLTYKLWRYLPVVIPGLLVSSRAVVLGLSMTFLVWAWRKSKVAAISISALGLVVVSVIGHMSSIDARLGIWQDTISGLTLFGHGLGSFEYLFPLYSKHMDMSIMRPVEAHNDILQLIFELGIGVIPLLAIIFKLLKVNDTHVYAIIFFIVVGCFAFPLHMPITAFMVALVAGQLARNISYSSNPINYFRSTLFAGKVTA